MGDGVNIAARLEGVANPGVTSDRGLPSYSIRRITSGELLKYRNGLLMARKLHQRAGRRKIGLTQPVRERLEWLRSITSPYLSIASAGARSHTCDQSRALTRTKGKVMNRMSFLDYSASAAVGKVYAESESRVACASR